MVKISVIIPIYNVENYLRECLNSICNQSFKDIEIICIDDDSTDSSLDILKEYEKKDSRVKVFSQLHNGVGSARNIGLNNAIGEYIYFIDSDDYLDENALKEFVEISEEKNLDLLIFKLMNFNEKTGEKDYDYSNMPFLEKFGDNVLTYEDFKENLFKMDVSVCTKFFKRELLLNKKFDEDVIFEDNIFFIDYILDAKRVYFYNKVLYNRRIREKSIITSSDEKHVDAVEVFNRMESEIRDKGLYGLFKEELFIAKINECHYRYSLSQNNYKENFFNVMKSDFESKKDEYERELDFKKIDIYSRTLYKNLLKYNCYEAYDLSMVNYHLENKLKKLKKENKQLKNNSVSSKFKKWSPF